MQAGLLSTMRMHYAHILWQSQLRNVVDTRLITYLKHRLEKECFLERQFCVQLYGSLHHNLFVPGISKINIDLSVTEGECPPVFGDRVLHVLTSVLQRSSKKDLEELRLRHPILVWHRTAHRPWLLLMEWDGIPVHVTYNNVLGVQVSKFMLHTLIDIPFLRLTLLYWKHHLRTGQPTPCMGPNTGQVSTYAIFTILYSLAHDMRFVFSITAFETIALLGDVP